MSIKITKSDVKWSYISLILFNGINLILLPFILAYLTPPEVGLWYTFTAIAGLVVILDFGFMTTLSRNITFIWSGANEITNVGFEKERLNSKPNYPLFIKVFKVTKLFYLLLSLLIYIILLTLGSYYIYKISIIELPVYIIFISWIAYTTAVFLNMRYAYWNAILRGIGAIKENQKLLIVTKVSQLVLTIILLLLGHGLIGVSVAYLVSVIINRVLANRTFYSYENNKEKIKPYIRQKTDKNELINIFRKILPNAYKQGIISVSNFINQRSLTLLSSAFLGLTITASLGFTLQIISLINVVANTFFNTYLAQFSAYRIKGEQQLLSQTLKKALGINYLIVISAYSLFIIFGSLILTFINSNVSLLPLGYSIIIMIYMFLYNNHVLFASFLATSNYLPHYKAFIISSVIVLFSQVISINVFGQGLWGLLLPLLFINLFYNNWKWPKEGIKDLDEEPKKFFIDVLKRIFNLPINKLKMR